MALSIGFFLVSRLLTALESADDNDDADDD